MRRYRLRPEFEGLSGQIAYGPNAETFDVGAEVAATGYIDTDDTVLQASLESYYGGTGRVFDVFELAADGTETQVDPDEAATAQSPGLITPPEITLDGSTEQAPAGDQSTQHSDAGGYFLLSVPELQELADERGLHVDSDTQADLVAALEADDAGKETGYGS